MTVKNNDVLGYKKCPSCGDRCSVHKMSRGKGRFFYTRCEECKADQRTGAKHQSDIYDNTDWISEKPEKPPNYVEKDWSPDEPKPKPKADSPPEKEQGSSPKGLAIFGVAVIGLAGAAMAFKAKNKKPEKPVRRPYGY